METVVDPTPLLGAIALAMGLGLLAWAVASAVDPRRRETVRALEEATSVTSTAVLVRAQPRVRIGVLEERLQELVSRRFPAAYVDRLQRKADVAGLVAPWNGERLAVLKVLLGLAGLVVGALLGAGATTANTRLVALALPFLAFFVPDVRLTSMAQDRQRAISLELADMLDLMSVTVEAGIAFEAAMARAANGSDGPLGAELARAIREIQVGIPRTQALRAVAERCDVADLSTVVAAIVQGERFGVPLARILRIQADELRDKRRQRAQEQAMKIPAKIILPLGVCILPALLMLLVGPAGLSIIRSFAELS